MLDVWNYAEIIFVFNFYSNILFKYWVPAAPGIVF